jgi:hypothetical protein
MEALAAAYPPEQLAAQAYTLYESFRPAIPKGTRGWGTEERRLPQAYAADVRASALEPPLRV